jgi:cysteine desulfurase
METIYFDYAATTPVDERVLESMLPYFTEKFGNPNSLYRLGREAYTSLEAAREQVAALLGAENPNEVLFTSGGTESDNAALVGIAQSAAAKHGNHVIVSAFEHHAVLEPAHWLEKNGFEVTYLRPREDGWIHIEDVQAALRDDTVLVSIMHGNNEIGTVAPIRAIADAVHAVGGFMHTDAAQTLGKVPFNVQELGVDAATFSGHKIYGPKGIGVLYLRKRTPFNPFLRGGGQEFRKRSGTQNVAGSIGFAAALQLMVDSQAEEAVRLAGLRDKVTETSVKGEGERIPGIASLLIKGVEGEAMLLQLDNLGFAVSTGSACSSGSLEPSHVLLSIGCPPEIAHGSLRISMGRHTIEEHVEKFLEVFPPIVERLRAMSPVYHRMFGSSV